MFSAKAARASAIASGSNVVNTLLSTSQPEVISSSARLSCKMELKLL